MKDWYQYQPWILTHRAQLRETRHLTHSTMALIPNSSCPMVDGPFLDPNGVLYKLPILDPSMKAMADDLSLDSKRLSYPHPRYWTHRLRIGINICHRAQLRESRHMIYDTTAQLPKNYGPIPDGPFRDTQGPVLSTHQILDPPMNDWYQYQILNLIHRAR